MPDKKRRVAIFILRNNQFKAFLPIIQEMFLSGEMIPVLITTKTINTGIKKIQNYDSRFNPFHDKMDIYYVNNLNDIATVAADLNIDILLTSSVPLSTLKEIKSSGIRVIYLQSSMDMVAAWPKTHSLEFLRLTDGFLCFSQYWIDGMIEEFKKLLNLTQEDVLEIRNKAHVVGMPELDQIKMLNKHSILEKYRLPATKKKIIFFDPVVNITHIPNFFHKYYFCLSGSMRKKAARIIKNLMKDARSSPTIWWKFPIYMQRILKGGQKISNYETLFLKLKRFCGEHDYLLICKSREKNNDPDFVKSGCDYYTYDSGYMPFTLLELLFISDLYIGFNSTAAMEAVYCNLPVILFQVFPTEYQFDDYGGNVYQFIERSLTTRGEWLNYPGVNQVYPWNRDEAPFLDSIEGLTIEPQNREDYITKFLGFNDTQSSNRILKILKNNYFQ